MRNIALILMYNGSAYHGWQVQKTEISVAATLERGLSMVCGEPIRVVAADGPTPVSTPSIMWPISVPPPVSPPTVCPSPSTPISPRISW